MIHLAPFESGIEHGSYCEAAGISMEEGSLGFKIFSDTEKLGLCQLKFVGEAAYILALKSVENRISVSMLANVFTSIIEFLKRVGIESVIYPVQNEEDKTVCEATGFDRISETLYVFDFPSDGETEEDDHHDCDCCGHHHSH